MLFIDSDNTTFKIKILLVVYGGFFFGGGVGILSDFPVIAGQLKSQLLRINVLWQVTLNGVKG